MQEVISNYSRIWTCDLNAQASAMTRIMSMHIHEVRYVLRPLMLTT